MRTAAKRIVLLSLSLFISAGICTAQNWEPPYPVREIPLAGLEDVAVATADDFGPVIYYNPQYVQMMGPELTTFFRAHEYGHIYLGHLELLQGGLNAWRLLGDRRELELAADGYAVEVLVRADDWGAVEAAYWFFMSQGPTSLSMFYPTGTERAGNIAAHAHNARRYN
jgi:hypothetical protein